MMKQIVNSIIVIFLTVISMEGIAQCPNDNTLFVDITPSGPGGYSGVTNAWGGDYFTVSVCAGATYTFTTCDNTTIWWDTELTLTTNAGAFIAYNDDYCGVLSQITWLATYTGVVRILIDEWSCVHNVGPDMTLICYQNSACGIGAGGVACTPIVDGTTDVGTFNLTLNGAPAINPIYLCASGGTNCFTSTSNGDYVLPPPANNNPLEVSEVMYAIFTCAPTTGDPATDPCYSGFLYSAGTVTECDNSTSPGIVGSNNLWYVPITADDGDNAGDPNGVINYDQDGNGCYDYDITQIVEVHWVPVISSVTTLNCDGTVDITISGGAPTYSGGNYIITNTGLGILTGTPITNNGTVTITGLTTGNAWSINVDDGGTCTTTISGIYTSNPATTSAGLDAIICANSTYILSGVFGGGASSITWTTSGDGSFNNASLPGATYTPGATDITNGTVTLTITTDDPVGPCLAATDFMVLTIDPIPTASAGIDATICSGSTYTLSGTIGGSASSSTWTTSGDGTFDNAALLGATYTPGATDITNGTVTLTITTDDPAGPCVAATDFMILTIDIPPTASAGIDGSICEGSTYTLSGTMGGGALSITWTTSGDGTFDNTALLGATYTPGATDITNGTVTLTITTDDPVGPCIAATDFMVLTIDIAPTASAGINATICSDGTYTLSGSFGGSASSIMWTTSGDGTFDNAALLGATYTPGATDITNGTVTLTITTDDPAGPCLAATDFMILTVNSIPTVSAGPDVTICSGGSYTLSGTMGGGASSIMWTTSGDGTFDNTALPGATYTPGATDITNGTVTLTITTDDPAGTCLAVTDFIVITIGPLPTTSAGADATICSDDTYTLSGSFGGSASSITWTTSGDGTFDNTALPGATYTPGATDITNGTVTLTITTDDPPGSCVAATDFMVLTIDIAPTTSAGADATICSDGTYTLSGSFGGSASSITWTTSGDGTFDNTALLGATYTPGATDITNGTVTLTITTDDPPGSCVAATDFMVLNIDLASTASAGSDVTICSGGSYTLSGTMGGGASSITWTTSGDGTFDNTSLLGATYTPGATDITNGTVTLTITTDAVGSCVAAIDIMVITISPSPTYSSVIGNENCGSADGSIVLTGAGGAGPIYNYSIDNGATFQTSDTFFGLIAGVYNIVVSDNAGCQVIGTDTVYASSTATTVLVQNFIPPLCNGGNNGSVTVMATGVGPLSYSLNGGPFQPGGIFTGLSAGPVSVDIKDANGCITTVTITVTEPAVISTTEVAVDETCTGNDGSIDLTTSGGTLPYNYSWTGPSSFTATTEDISFLIGGTYDVVITDYNGCVFNNSYTLTTGGGPTITGVNITNASCTGVCDGQVIINAIGTGALTYNLTGMGNNTTGIYTGVCAGSYTLDVTDGNGCLTSQSVTVVDNGIVVADFTANPTNGFAPLDVTFTNNSSNATTYLWNFGTGDTSILSDPNYIFSSGGTFTVVLFAYNGSCYDSATVSIVVIGESTLIIPNVFTPNGDGINDIWIMQSLGIILLHGEVFNRWGELVYSWNGDKGWWDGRTAPDGQLCPEGTYFYSIVAEGFEGQLFDESGEITLLRGK